MKKVFILLIILLTISFVTIPANAAGAPESATGIVSPNFVGITLFSVDLSIDGSGYSTSTGFVRPSSSGYTSYLTLSLQKNTANGWATLKSWSGSGTGLSGVNLSGSYYVAGGSYRTMATTSVYDSTGKLIDTASAYSGERKF